MNALIEKFRSSALERVQRLDALVVAFEQGEPSARDDIARELHTLKGESKMLGFSDVNLVSHLAEDVVLAISAENDIELLVEAFDVLRALLTKAAGKLAAPIDLVGFVYRCHGIVVERRASVAPRKVEAVVPITPSTQTGVRVELGKLEQVAGASSELLLAARQVSYVFERLVSTHHEFDIWFDEKSELWPVTVQRQGKHFLTEVEAKFGEISEITRELALNATTVEEQSRQLRHVGVAQGFQHYPRAVRDLAKQIGKKIRFDQSFGDVEVDRSIVSGLSEPLLHLIRNAVDHGIEPPELRAKLGKPEEGAVSLSARYTGSTIDIELRDDGAGIDGAKIRQLAIERGLITAADALSDDESIALIFESGFTTKDAVTDVSGRGIGMDIVRRELARLGGTIEIESEVSVGTTVRIRVPITGLVASIIEFRLGAGRFAVPSRDIQRVAGISPADLFYDDNGDLALIDEDQVYRFYDWRETFGDRARPFPRHSMNVLIGSQYRHQFAFWVDELFEERTAITRPLDGFLSGLSSIDGLALTETGETVPLINIFGLLERTGSDKKRSTRIHQTSQVAAIRRPQTKTILVVEDSEITRNLVAGILRDQGFFVIEAEDGAEGFDALHKHKIDLVLSDVQMPRLDGVSLVKKIREKKRFEMLPIIMLTTLGSPEDKLRAMNAGASAYLIKLNFREAELIETVRRLTSD